MLLSVTNGCVPNETYTCSTSSGMCCRACQTASPVPRATGCATTTHSRPSKARLYSLRRSGGTTIMIEVKSNSIFCNCSTTWNNDGLPFIGIKGLWVETPCSASRLPFPPHSNTAQHLTPVGGFGNSG